MSLFGSLFTGVSALSAQGQNTAIISNNIANLNTTGFKRSEASFFSLVTTESRSSRFSPGTVSVNRLQRVDQQGAIQQTASSTDASISGNGFFPIKRAPDDLQEFLYTRNGSFSENSQGLLTNSAGFTLYAWPLDQQGELPANQGDLTSLVPADVAFLGGLTRPTTDAEIALNLDADQQRTSWSGGPATPISADGPAHFSRGLTVFDELGSAQTLTLEFNHIEAPTALAKSNTATTLDRATDLDEIAGVTDGETFDITVGGTTQTFEYDNDSTTTPGNIAITTVGDLIDGINDNFTGGDAAEARLTADGEVIIEVVDRANTLTLNDTGADDLLANLGFSTIGSAIAAPALPPGNTTSVGPEGNEFPDFEDLENANTQGWWQMQVLHPDGTELTRGALNFDGSGSLNAALDQNGDIDVQLQNIDWGNGSALQDISIDVERFSQFAGNFDVISSDQNGAELGLRTGVEITREGRIVARFSNGASADLYQIPLTTFANANGLNEVSGTAYSETDESGEENLREAGSGGAGFVEPSTLEASNVDLADEFAKLIVSQRAYSSGTRVISTVDEMTQELLRLR